MFAGIGGFRSGLERVGGFECVGYCEIDKFAKQAYEALYDTSKEVYYDDATKIVPEDVPDIDLIVGGFPCQSFSIAGKRRGFEDARGTMFFEIARIAAVKRPRYLLLENVPGLLSHDEGRTFAAILSALDELGYDVAWQVLNSADFGVAQARKRVFIIGFLRTECAGRILSFTDANPKTLIQRIPGKEGCSVYSPEGLSITLTGTAGGFGGKSGLYEILGLPIKSLTKTGYQIAVPGDSIDLAYADMNSRRGRVGHDIAHTVTPSATQGLQTHEQFSGTWLSDYVPNRLGGFIEEQHAQEQKKPDCPLIGEDSNIFHLMGIASKTLKRNGMTEQAKEMCDRITSSGDYNKALCIIGEYVNITSVDDDEPEESEDEEMEVTMS